MSANMKRMIPTNEKSKMHKRQQCVTVSELPSFFVVAKSNNKHWTFDEKMSSSSTNDMKCVLNCKMVKLHFGMKLQSALKHINLNICCNAKGTEQL